MADFQNLDIASFQASAAAAALLLRSLGNEQRLMILCQLTAGERTAGALAPPSGLSQSALSQHLGVLREQGIVATRREARSIYYRIVDQSALRVVALLAEIFCPPNPESSYASGTD